MAMSTPNDPLEVYQDALTVSRELKQRSTEARALNVLGSVDENFGNEAAFESAG